MKVVPFLQETAPWFWEKQKAVINISRIIPVFFYGGAIYAVNATLKITGNTYFEENSPVHSASRGGAIFAAYSVFILSGMASFIGTAADRGGAISMVLRTTAIFSGTMVEFVNNSAAANGGAIASSDSNRTAGFCGEPSGCIRWWHIFKW